MGDNAHKVGASVVAVDPKAAAAMRDKMARDQLSERLPEQRSLHVLAGLRMTVPYTLKVVCASQDEASTKVLAEKVLDECFADTDSKLNNYNPESEIAKINVSESTNEVKISQPLINVLQAAYEVTRTTGGSFDPAYVPAAEYVRFHRTRPLPDAEAAELREIIKYSSLLGGFSLNTSKGTLKKLHPKARIDLGGISKGYTVDRVIESLNEKGCSNCFFDWGGDCRGAGVNAGLSHWAVGIVRPPPLQDLLKPREDDPPLLRVVHLDNEALSTSGDYENVSRDERPGGTGVTTTTFDIHHADFIVPSNTELAQVSIKNSSCMYADALATAAFEKRHQVAVRNLLESWRFQRYGVTDYTTYIRSGELVARMHEIAKESDEMRAKRVSMCLPARVIVIGGGLAGLSAALEAAACGASVVVLEKWNKVGGNSAKATSGINGWGTRAQAHKGVQDGGKYFERDTFKSGVGGNTRKSLVKTLSVKSSEAINWLIKANNLPLTVISQLGGHSKARTHRAPDLSDGTPVPIGYTIMQHLEANARSNPRIQILTNTEVTELTRYVHEQWVDGSSRTFITGVKYRTTGTKTRPMLLLADAVILATGGFSNDRTQHSLMREYATDLFGAPTTNGPFATGDGVKMARSIGATLVDMDKVQLHPTGLLDPKDPAALTKYLGPEALRGSGGILVNGRGERFVNELDIRSAVSQAIEDQHDVYPKSNGAKFAYCIMSEVCAKLFGVNSLSFYWKRLGLFQYAKDVAEAAKIMGVPEQALTATLKEYEHLSKTKTACSDTGKAVYPAVVGLTGPYYIAVVTPTIHYTMGGALITPSAEILSSYKSTTPFSERRPIHRLFGAGEVTGGVHGGNRLGGNSLLECVVFGRIAGDRAATILQKKREALSLDEWTTVVVRETLEGPSYGEGSRIIRFNLPGALQNSGLKLGQFVAIRGEWDGQQLIGYYSPISLPDDLGVIGLLVRVDKGTLKEWISALRPGDAIEMKKFGGLVIERLPSKAHFAYKGAPIRRIAMIAGGTGVAPMLQLLRAALKHPYTEGILSLRLVYAAEQTDELTYRDILENFQETSRGKFKCHFVLNQPPLGWIHGVGFVDKTALTHTLQPPSNDLLVVICGPPVMQRIVKSLLGSMGYNSQRVRTVDETDPTPAVSKL